MGVWLRRKGYVLLVDTIRIKRLRGTNRKKKVPSHTLYDLHSAFFLFSVEYIFQQEQQPPGGVPKREGILGFFWKLSRIGERLSPYVGVGCVLMAIHVLFIQ